MTAQENEEWRENKL